MREFTRYKKFDRCLKRRVGAPKRRHNEVAYFLRIAKKRGKGILEECEGIITLLDTKTRIQASWEGANMKNTEI